MKGGNNFSSFFKYKLTWKRKMNNQKIQNEDSVSGTIFFLVIPYYLGNHLCINI